MKIKKNKNKNKETITILTKKKYEKCQINYQRSQNNFIKKE